MGASTTRRTAILTALAAAPLAAPALAQPTWPDRPLRFVVPFGAGGQTDIVSRVAAESISARLGQQVIVDNRPGGNGNLAADAVVRAPADGYTVLIAGLGTNSGLNALLYRSVPFDWQRDFAHVGLFCTTANMLIVHNSIPGANFAQVVAWIRANPGRFTYASASTGAITHLVMEDLGALLNLDMLHVAYRQTTQAMTDLLAGRVHARAMGVPEAEVVRGQPTIRPVAVSTRARRPEWPDVPTMAETLPGYEASAYFGLSLPRATPPEIVARLNVALNETLADERVRAAYVRAGADPSPPNTPEQFASHAMREHERWGGLIRRLGLQAQ